MEKIMKKKIVSCILIFILLGSICIPTLAATASELENEKKEIEVIAKKIYKHFLI